jgi:DNA-binding CsgD family transcriptional regulator/tetratricopeptide (TPR) repeat protein
VAGVVTGFVGRARELSHLQGTLGGDARLVLVSGDAGVGKTRFVGEARRCCESAGMVWISGGCLPLSGELPLLPISEALSELSRLDDGSQLNAALSLAAPYVRAEVERLLPGLGKGEPIGSARGESGRRDRLFSAVTEVLGTVSARAGLVLVIEDVHWADSATLDYLTYLARAASGGALTMVVTCRSDERPADAKVTRWLTHMRSSSGVQEIRLRPMSRGEVMEQIAWLVGKEPPLLLVDDVYARAEGNPFFTEQLVAAAMTDSPEGMLRPPGALPERLAELLAARASGCGDDAQAVLAGLAVAGRPLGEAHLSQVTGLSLAAVREGLRELSTGHLLAAGTAEGTHRPRHALLAEAVAAGLLPGERGVLHERTALALAAADAETLAAEIAGHWSAAGHSARELPARVAAAEAAQRVFGFAEAAAHWQRAIELCGILPGDTPVAGLDLPGLYVRAIDALDVSGDIEGAGELAEEAYRRFANHPDRPTAALIHSRAAFFRGMYAPASGLPLIKEALRLFAQEPPSAEQSQAWFDYASTYLLLAEGQREAFRAALDRALQIAEAAGATALVPQIMANLAVASFFRGQVEEGFATLHRGQLLAAASGDGGAILLLAINESDALLKTGEFQRAADVAQRGLLYASQTGRHTGFPSTELAANAAESLLALGRTAQAATLIDPLTSGPAGPDRHLVHASRAEIDMLRGDIEAATRRLQQVAAFPRGVGSIVIASESARLAAELALWARRPGDALEDVQRGLSLFKAPDLTIFCGRLLVAGMRACADQAEQARARRDNHAARAAQTAADDLCSWVRQMANLPFTDHPFVATIPADRADWDAEHTRLEGVSDPVAWATAAKTWDGLGCPHRAGYAWWRQAQAQLDARQPAPVAAAALQAAAAAAAGHAPLLTQIHALAQRARIPLQGLPETQNPAAVVPGGYDLTRRELDVLRLLAAGSTNAQIGAELFISPRTAGVHVTNILRKLGVANRVQAAALAERAGLIPPPQA